MNRKYILALSLLFIIAFPYILYHNSEKYTFAQGHFASYNFVQDRFVLGRSVPCLDFLKQGTLYEGQPYCKHGPVLYLTLYPFTIFGDYFNLAIAMFSFLLISLLFIYGNKIIKKESNKENLVIYTLLFCLVVLTFILHRFASLIATFFFFFAVYILFYTRLKYKELFAGILITFSIFSKFTFLAFVPFILGYYFYKTRKLNFKVLCLFLVPFLFLVVVFRIIWSNFLVYSFLTHIAWRFVSSSEPTSIFYLQIFKTFLPLSLNLFILLVGILFLSYLFYKNRKIIYFVTLVGAIILYLWSSIYDRFFLADAYYFLPTFLFLSIILVIKFNLIKNKYIKYTLITILLLLILFPAIKNSYLESNFNEIQSLTTGVFKELPITEGKVLGNIPLKDLKSYGLNINKEDYKLLREYGLSPFMLPERKGFEYWGIYNETQWQSYVDNIYIQYSNEIISGKYSLILFSPMGHQTDFSMILNNLKGNQLTEKYCVFKISDFSIGLNIEPAIYLFLKKDKIKCDIYYQIITNYYTKSFSKICDKSSVAGLLTKLVLSTTSPAYANLECKYKKFDFLLKYYNKKLFSSKQKEIDLNNVSECFALTKDNRKLGVGKVCKSVNDCKEYFEDSRAYFCEKSKFKIDYPIKVCYTKENCEPFFSDEHFRKFLECNKNLCMYLSSFDSIGYMIPSHYYPFPELAGFYVETKEATKDMFLNIVEDYVS